jgi:hypothetical protein
MMMIHRTSVTSHSTHAVPASRVEAAVLHLLLYGRPRRLPAADDEVHLPACKHHVKVHIASTLPAHCPHIASTLPAHCQHIASTLPAHCQHIAPTLPACKHHIKVHIAGTLPAHCPHIARMQAPHKGPHCPHIAPTLPACKHHIKVHIAPTRRNFTARPCAHRVAHTRSKKRCRQ